MTDIINPSTTTTIHPIVIPIITYFLGIFSTPLRKLVYSENKEYCTFDNNYTMREAMKHPRIIRSEIIVKKVLGKTTNINCPYYKSKDTEIIKHKGEKKYLQCKYGKIFDPEKEDIKKCPFYK
jgi:hypothetical protein